MRMPERKPRTGKRSPICDLRLVHDLVLPLIDTVRQLGKLLATAYRAEQSDFNYPQSVQPELYSGMAYCHNS